MERLFGADFSAVRIHDDAAAARWTRAFGASALAMGRDLAFGPGRYSPASPAGANLLGHELAHTIQQDGSLGSSSRTSRRGEAAEREADAAGRDVEARRPTTVRERAPLLVARQRAKQAGASPAWHDRLDEILPKRVGLVAHMHRVTTLLDALGEARLEWLVDSVHGDAAARAIVLKHGVPGLLALSDTAAGGKLDPAAATKALAQKSPRPVAPAAPAPPAGPAYWFQEPGVVAPGSSSPGTATTAAQQRSQVFVEPETNYSHVGHVAVRFAYPSSEVGRAGESRAVKKAKEAILKALAEAIGETTATMKGGTAAWRRQEHQIRARLKEALAGFTDAKPLNVFIATLESPAELGASHPPPTTDTIYVSPQDVGDPAKLQAAIRFPVRHVLGGVSATGAREAPATIDELKKSVLHESLHVLLINRSADGDAVWSSQKQALTITGPDGPKRLCETLLKGYLVAQEELFVYDHVATVFPPADQAKARYEQIVTAIDTFLGKHGGKTDVHTVPLKVAEKVDGKPVPWSVSYKVPRSATVTDADMNTMKFLLSLWPAATVSVLGGGTAPAGATPNPTQGPANARREP